jgi:signal transduction histidine kinase
MPSHVRDQAPSPHDAARIAANVASLPVRRWVERRRVVLLAAALLFAGVFALRMAGGDATDGIDLLYVVPVSLVALELGLPGGAAAAALALALLAAWALATNADLAAVGVSARAVAYAAVGLIAGRFSDRMREGQTRHRQLLDTGLAVSHLTRDGDLPANVARDIRVLLGARGVAVELDDGPTVSDGTLGDDVERVAIVARKGRAGTLTVDAGRRLSDEDRTVLGIVAVQVAVAADNRQVLELERERTAIRTELGETRRRLDERSEQIRRLMLRHEAERHEVADQLHEDAAQMLTAVLLGLRAIERELGSAPAPETLGAVRSDVDATLRSLRDLAVSLRPPSLSLGLRAALEGLADGARERGIAAVTIAVDDATDLAPEDEALAFRAVEDAIGAIGAAGAVRVATRGGGERLAIDVDDLRDVDADRLAVLHARLELAGGTLERGDATLRAVLPLRSAASF